MAKDYEVGYGRPPKKHQWPKGTSGNRRGPKVGHKKKKTTLRDALNRKVTIHQDKTARKVTVFEALVENLIAKAINGKVHEQIKLFGLIEKHAPEFLESLPDQTPQKIVVEYVLPDGKTVEDYDEDEPHSTERNGRLAGTEAREPDPDNEEAAIEAAWRASGIDDAPEDGSEQ